MESYINWIVKAIESLIFKGFGIIYECVKSMGREWS